MNTMLLSKALALGAGVWMVAVASAAGPGEEVASRAQAFEMEPASQQRAEGRSALWMAVSTHRSGQEAADLAPQRRLSAEQLLELREQIRQAASMRAAAPTQSPAR